MIWTRAFNIVKLCIQQNHTIDYLKHPTLLFYDILPITLLELIYCLLLFYSSQKIPLFRKTNIQEGIIDKILIYSSMLLRKTRQHFHGSSNRSLSAQNIHALHPLSSFAQPENKNQPLQKPLTTTSHLRKRNIKDRKQNCSYFDDKDSQNMQKPCKTQSQLRSKYQSSRRILKILKNWGVSSKGCLSRDQFKEQVKKKINKSIKEQQLNNLFQKYSKNSQQINVHNLIELLKGKTEGIPFNFRTFSTEQSQPFRDKLIDDLSQNLRNFKSVDKKELTDSTLNSFISKFNSAVSKMKQINQGHIDQNKKDFFRQLIRLSKFNQFEKSLLNHVELTSDFKQFRQLVVANKSVDYLLADPILRNTRTKLLKTQGKQNETQKYLQYTRNMQSSTQLFQNLLTTQMKRKDFDPKTLYHVNQAKTRFGRSLFTKETNGWIASQKSSAVHPNQKDKILDTLKSQQQLQKTRYQNKLNKIREWRSKEMESVAQRSCAIQQRKQGSLLRIREQQEAYNYVNFVKKVWE